MIRRRRGKRRGFAKPFIEKYETEDLSISTCRVEDAEEPFETAIKHSSYNNGEWIIVAEASTTEEALYWHNKWIDIMLLFHLTKEYC